MSVYTEVSATDLAPFLADFQAGTLQDLHGIRDGIENTNYFLTTEQGEYVLTLFEHLAEAEIQFTLELMDHLAAQGLPCARPLKDQAGNYLGHLHGKPASLVSRLSGSSPKTISAEHCQAIGQVLAQMHLAGQQVKKAHDNPRGAAWRESIRQKLTGHLDRDQQALMDDEVACQQQAFARLPHGVIHSDLFRDNVLFTGHRLTGLLDLYDAGHDLLLYDLAITATDWCSDDAGHFDPARLQALLQAYHKQRPVTDDEKTAWPLLLRRAALRFWLSRLYSLYYPREGQLTQQKDPAVYQQLLENYRQKTQIWPI